MKKIKLLFVIATIFLLAGCGEVEPGKYNMGTYFGYNTTKKAMAVVYVNEEGYIKSVFVDELYQKESGGTTTYSTKQILKDEYGMKKASAIALEWYQQAENVTDKVMQEQGITWMELKYKTVDENGNDIYTSTQPTGQTESQRTYTDTVSGVTMKVDTIYDAIQNALNQAKK